MKIGVELDEGQVARYKAWKEEQARKMAGRSSGVIGGAFVWTLCWTTIGVVVKVRNDLTHDELDLSNYERW